MGAALYRREASGTGLFLHAKDLDSAASLLRSDAMSHTDNFRPELEGTVIYPGIDRSRRMEAAVALYRHLICKICRIAKEDPRIILRSHDRLEYRTDSGSALYRIPKPEQIHDFTKTTLTGRTFRKNYYETQALVTIPSLKTMSPRDDIDLNLPQAHLGIFFLCECGVRDL